MVVNFCQSSPFQIHSGCVIDILGVFQLCVGSDKVLPPRGLEHADGADDALERQVVQPAVFLDRKNRAVFVPNVFHRDLPVDDRSGKVIRAQRTASPVAHIRFGDHHAVHFFQIIFVGTGNVDADLLLCPVLFNDPIFAVQFLMDADVSIEQERIGTMSADRSE